MIRPSRRDALRLLAAHVPLALAGCSKPRQEIVPYVTMPERVVPGEPLRFASVLPLSGFGRGVIVTSVEGRPIKIEGNPKHPASLGATDVFAEADIFSLYDPDRSRTPLANGEIVSWEALRGTLSPELDGLRANGGEGLALVTPRLRSPTFHAQIQAFLAAYPKARWFAYDPLDVAEADAGMRAAFGADFIARPDLAEADVVVSFGQDFLGPGPEQIAFARAYGHRRLAADRPMSRIHVLESTPTITGAKADFRHVVAPVDLAEMVVELANGLGANLRAADLGEDHRQTVRKLLDDLRAPNRKALVLAGPHLPAHVHALCHWINATLSAPVSYAPRVDAPAGHEPAGLADLARALNDKSVSFLVTIGVNPAYDAPADLALAEALSRVQRFLHAGIYHDETAAHAKWHVPLTHPLEAWSDWYAPDGTAAVGQPLIDPLHASRSHHEVLALLMGANTSGYDIVRATWQKSITTPFDTWWQGVLRDGVVPPGGPRPAAPPKPALPQVPPPAPRSESLTLLLAPDPAMYDGARANNAWLQELPKPLTKQVWGNALQIGPEDAARLGIDTGDDVTISVGARSIDCVAHVMQGHAPGVLALSLGYGRTSAGMIGDGIGANAFALRDTAHGWTLPDVRLTKTGHKSEVLLAQRVVSARDLGDDELHKRFPVLHDLRGEVAGPGPLASLYPERPRPPADHAWGMVIDTAVCIGCNACVVACQAENNIPVVGPEQIEIGRFMQWLRIDTYDRGDASQPFAGFQPVPCMHCEKAPCEPVCPVEASVHDGEGLNVQVYNRCIGTRFCEANCPYKVRRFNFRAYADGEEFANLGADLYRAQKNPDVTVRTRGVMEKCTYCVQRISRARRESEKEDRPIGVNEVTTACQDACPTRAITFGDLARPDDTVNALRKEPRHYALLAELDTRPRTTYLAELRDEADASDGAAR